MVEAIQLTNIMLYIKFDNKFIWKYGLIWDIKKKKMFEKSSLNKNKLLLYWI